MKSFFEGFIFQERKLDHIHRLVVSEVTVSSRKELSPFPIIHHFFDDPRHKFFVFFFRILFIEDAVGSISKTDTSETIVHIIDAISRVEEIANVCPTSREK